MKVLLVRYYSEKKVHTAMPKSTVKVMDVFPPLGICYIASVVERAGHKVEILDPTALKLTAAQVKDAIAKAKPDVVGISCTTPNVHGVLEVSSMVKEIDKSIKVVVGGPHMMIYPKETLSFPFIDYGVMGEGEYVMVELLNYLENGGDPSSIDGLVWKKNRETITNKIREPIKNLDELPFPARHLIPMESYGATMMKRPMTTLIGSRGCPFSCAYCFKSKFDRAFRVRSPKKIVDEVEDCISKYKIKYVSFYDDCWPKEQMRGLCNELIERGIDIEWETPDRLDLIDPDLLKLMRKAGCVRLRFGVESGSQRILDLMDKKIKVERIREGLVMTKNAGIETLAFLMLGYPTETEEDYRMTMKLLKECKVDWALFNYTIPLPQTRLWDLAVKEYGYDPDYWKKWSLGLTDKPLTPFVPHTDELCKKAFREFYIRPEIIWNKVRNIRSPGDFKKYWEGFMSIVNFEVHDDLQSDSYTYTTSDIREENNFQ